MLLKVYKGSSKKLISEIFHLRQETQYRLRNLLVFNPCLLKVYGKGILVRNGLRILASNS